MSECDALVVGAGPAGCAAAIHAARAGLRVTLVDRARFPRPKACGEGVMPAGAAALRELGVWEEARALGAPFDGVRYTSAAGRTAAGRFPGGRFGLGAPRERLDDALWRAARACPGVSAFDGRDASEFSAPWTVYSDGGAARAAEALGVSRRAPAPRRFGLSARFSRAGRLDGKVEVFLCGEGELYVTPLPEGCARVALLLEERALRGAPETVFDQAVARCEAARPLLAGAFRASPVLGAGPLGARPDRVFGPNWLLAGDAAGALDPVIGDGVAAALQTGRLAGLAVAAAAGGDASAFSRYARERARALRAPGSGGRRARRRAPPRAGRGRGGRAAAAAAGVLRAARAVLRAGASLGQVRAAPAAPATPPTARRPRRT